MTLRLHAARQAAKLGLVVGVFATLAGIGQIADATPAARHPVLRPAVSVASEPTAAPRTAAATGTVELPPDAAGEPGHARLAATEYDFARARRMNAALAFSTAPILAAKPFTVSGSSADRARALICLTQAVYFEAGYEPSEGQRAVAQVVLNRMRHPIFPHSVCGVVFQGAELQTGCQFSFTCDGSLLRGTPPAAAWRRSQDVARAALAGYVEKAVGMATHYHTDYVAPYWMTTVTKMTRVGQHIFYRWPGAVGLPAAFGERYAAIERPPSLTLLAALHPLNAAPGAKPGEAATLAEGVTLAKEDGRVHVQFAAAAAGALPAETAVAETPTARRAALLAGRGGSVPAGLETVTLNANPVAETSAPAASSAPAAGGAAG